MAKRPGGYGETALLEKSPYYGKYINNRPYWVAGMICLPLLIIGLLPLMALWFGFPSDFSFSAFGVLANNGVLMKPYIVKKIIYNNWKI